MKSLPFISADTISRLKKGDEAAFRVVFDNYSPVLYSFVDRFLKEKEQSEEIIQETFLNLWINKAGLMEKYPIGAYLFTISRRLTLNKLRNIASSRTHREKLWKTMQKMHNDTEEAVLLNDLQNFTEKALVRLTGQQQLVFRLSRYEGLSHEEIANRLKISRNTVKNHMVEALKSLRIHFKQSDASFMGIIYFLLNTY